MAPGNPQTTMINAPSLGGPSSNPVTNQILEANNVSPLSFMDELNATQFELSTRFNYSQAIVWQIKYIISCYLTKKTLPQASAALQDVSKLVQYGLTMPFLIFAALTDLCLCVAIREIWYRL
jgi:hypothetical protein